MKPIRLRILLVAPPNFQRDGRRLARGLAQLGHQVYSCADAQEALRLADQHLPDAVVTTSLSPPLDAVELCWAIRKTSRIPTAVFVILGSNPNAETRINAYQTGADLFLTTPLSIRELAAYLESQVGLRTGIGVPELTLSGNLAQMKVLDLLQVISSQARSGRLDVWSEQGERGLIYVRKGDPIHAEFEQKVGRTALISLARLDRGAYRFLHESRFPSPTITEPATRLILDLARELDEGSAPEEARA